MCEQLQIRILPIYKTDSNNPYAIQSLSDNKEPDRLCFSRWNFEAGLHDRNFWDENDAHRQIVNLLKQNTCSSGRQNRSISAYLCFFNWKISNTYRKNRYICGVADFGATFSIKNGGLKWEAFQVNLFLRPYYLFRQSQKNNYLCNNRSNKYDTPRTPHTKKRPPPYRAHSRT